MKLLNSVSEKREVVPAGICPVDFLISIIEQATNHVFVLSKTCIADIALGRMPKEVKRQVDGDLIITWNGTDDIMKLKEIDETHQYILYHMHMDGKEYSFEFTESNVIYLER